MVLRSYLGNVLIGVGRKIGRSEGDELAVILSDHSIELEMVNPNDPEWAWDHNFYRYGNVFAYGYANPIKPKVKAHPEDDDKADTIETDEGDGYEPESGSESRVPALIPSGKYKSYMVQHLIEQVLDPTEQWRKILYLLVAMGALQFMTIIVILWANGSFNV